MRVIHIADCHLLMEPEKGTAIGAIRKKEIASVLERIVDACNEQEADLLLIAGDLFHTRPRLRDIKEADYTFSKLKKTRVVLIAGNHDYVSAHSFYREYEWQGPVTMLVGDELEHVTFADLHTSVYGFSYHTRDIYEPLYDDVQPAGDGIQILLAHGGDEKNVPMNRKKIAAAGFEYVALGHIHKPEILCGNMAYAGSPEPLDRNETGEHGYMLVDITGEEGAYKTAITFVPCALREYRDISLPVTGDDTNGLLKDRLRQMVEQEGSRHMYRVTLTGKHNAELETDTEGLKDCGLITEVQDRTLPEYNLEELRRINADNLLGMYIGALSGGDTPEEKELHEKALYYGLEALMNGGRQE